MFSEGEQCSGERTTLIWPDSSDWTDRGMRWYTQEKPGMSYFEECGYLRLAGRQQTILFLEDFIHTVKEISVSPGNPGNRDGSAQLRNISPLFTFNYSVASKKEFPFQPRMGRFFLVLLHCNQYHIYAEMSPGPLECCSFTLIRSDEQHWEIFDRHRANACFGFDMQLLEHR